MPERWLPMSEFDPSKPALVHDKLNDQVIDWEPERHGKDYKAGHRDFGDGRVGRSAARPMEGEARCPPG
jgi:hypothetical protein